MNEEEITRMLRSLLEREGAAWTADGGDTRFRLRHDGMVWETLCRPRDGLLMVYGRFPFRCADVDRARRVCDEANATLVRGALYVLADGSPVYRCTAELDDVYGAEERLTAALQYSAQTVTHFWGRLSGL